MTNSNSFCTGTRPRLFLASQSRRQLLNSQQLAQSRSVVINPDMTTEVAREIRRAHGLGLAVLRHNTRATNSAVDWYAMSPCSSLLSESGSPMEVEGYSDDFLQQDILRSLAQEADTGMIDAPTPKAEVFDSTDTYMDPYGTAADAGFDVPEGQTEFARAVLSHSGVNTFTDYPLSTSPRMEKGVITGLLNRLAAYHNLDRIDTSMEVGQEIRVFCTAVQPGLFNGFSYTASHQPRTEAARADEPVSPKTIPGGAERLIAAFDSE